MSNETEIHTYALQRFAPDPSAVYPLDLAAHLAQMPRHAVLVCCKRGLISAVVDPVYGGYSFNVATIRTLQRIGYLRTDCGVNLAGIEIILQLLNEVEQLRGPEHVNNFHSHSK
jgi:DNA-binding transcriptional MerR regulator